MNLYTVRNNIMKGVPLQELKLRVCFYARVSTDKDEQLHSLSAQISFFSLPYFRSTTGLSSLEGGIAIGTKRPTLCSESIFESLGN